MDVHTGEILAMANAPDFDPNHFAQAPENAWRDRAVADSYEPGSTFKVLTLTGANGYSAGTTVSGGKLVNRYVKLI